VKWKSFTKAFKNSRVRKWLGNFVSVERERDWAQRSSFHLFDDGVMSGEKRWEGSRVNPKCASPPP
jgi:hypothetical protein